MGNKTPKETNTQINAKNLEALNAKYQDAAKKIYQDYIDSKGTTGSSLHKPNDYIHTQGDFDKIGDSIMINGKNLPYMLSSDSGIFTEAAGILYVEFTGDFGPERYAVHRKDPDHECNCNCDCIKNLITEHSANRGIDTDTENINHIDTATRNAYLASATSDDAVTNQKNFGVNCNKEGVCKIHLTGGCGCAGKKMAGGADDTSDSNDELTESSSDYLDNQFSATSSDELSDTSDNPADAKGQKTKKKNVIGDSSDEEDEEDEDLEIEDEEVAETGFVLESDISSSDLYRFQKNLFQSETDSDMDDIPDYLKASKSKQARVKFNKSNKFDHSLTREIKKAVNNLDNGLFDSEAKEILGMTITSDTDRYLKRPINRNNKYY